MNKSKDMPQWGGEWRDKVWSQLDQPWDIIVVGGGITGAGIFLEATRAGLNTLLLEQRDFAWGTSSRSSKLVHGGLRYLMEGKLKLTVLSVRERQRLLGQAPGLIHTLGFLLVTYEGKHPGRWIYKTGLVINDVLSMRRDHRYYSATDFLMLAPHIEREGLKGGFAYHEALTDDARLVLRLIREAATAGGLALNYVKTEGVIRKNGRVVGVAVRDALQDRRADITAQVVVNATGAWANALKERERRSLSMRPLRGSHLVFPSWRVPVAQVVCFATPEDGRHVMAIPWEGATLIGNTDLDHDRPMDEEPKISPWEFDYLMNAAKALFPSLGLTPADVISSFTGLRPVIGTGRADPSKESREHVVLDENGLLTITGGKLTTFRLIAMQALKAARRYLPHMPEPGKDAPILNRANDISPEMRDLDEAGRERLWGRLGADAPCLLAEAKRDELQKIPGTMTLWAELRWAARSEGVVHLEDLLLRRVRLGLLLPEGGKNLLPQIRSICQTELGWDDARWKAEEAAYLHLWRSCYCPPVLRA